MPLVKCRYCARRVEEKTLMRHYSQTGCLQRAMASSPTTTRHRRRHPQRPSHSHPPLESQSDTVTPATPLSSENQDTVPDTGEIPPFPSGSTRDPRIRYPRVWLEEVPDEGDFPVHCRITDVHPTAGRPLPGIFKTTWEKWRAREEKEGTLPWGEFRSPEDWSFARFLMKSGLSQEKIDELLHLEVVRSYIYVPSVSIIIDMPLVRSQAALSHPFTTSTNFSR